MKTFYLQQCQGNFKKKYCKEQKKLQRFFVNAEDKKC